MAFNNNKNKYLKNIRILNTQFRGILKEFCFDSTAAETAERIGVSRKTINRIFHLMRIRIVTLCEKESMLSGDIEIDESYFGARRVRGKRGRGARGKIPVVGNTQAKRYSIRKANQKLYQSTITACDQG